MQHGDVANMAVPHDELPLYQQTAPIFLCLPGKQQVAEGLQLPDDKTYSCIFNLIPFRTCDLEKC